MSACWRPGVQRPIGQFCAHQGWLPCSPVAAPIRRVRARLVMRRRPRSAIGSGVMRLRINSSGRPRRLMGRQPGPWARAPHDVTLQHSRRAVSTRHSCWCGQRWPPRALGRHWDHPAPRRRRAGVLCRIWWPMGTSLGRAVAPPMAGDESLQPVGPGAGRRLVRLRLRASPRRWLGPDAGIWTWLC
jgi:hypothetical protein